MSKRVHVLVLFGLCSFAIRGLYIFLFHGCVSFDLNLWNQTAAILLAGENPYHSTNFLGWPPFWMQLIFLFKKVSLAWHLPFNDIVRIFLIAVESLVATVLYATLSRFVKSAPAGKLLMFGIALNPICIFQVCQHCNFDVLAGFWILFAVYLLLRFQEQHEPRFWLGACFALGMGGATKTVPLCLAPLLLLSVRKLKTLEQFLGIAYLLVPVLLPLSVLYVLAPADVETKVLGYRGGVGAFGVSGLLLYFDLGRWLKRWALIFEMAYGALWLLFGAWLWSKEKIEPRQLVSVALILLMAIPALGPGYGLQYIYWYLPLLVLMYALSDRRTRILLLVWFAVAAATYTVAYAFNFNSYGAFFLDIIQTKGLLDFGLRISTKAGETLLCLPLWVSYLILVAFLGAETGRDIASGFRLARRHRVEPLER